MSIKLIITDIDGVWTDGGMYYADNGIETKKFNTSDSVGVLLAAAAHINVAVMTGEDVPCVRNRIKKLNIEHAHFGVRNKLLLVEQLIEREKISFEQIAFIGDEINDHPLLHKVGFSACPQSAPWYTKEIVDFIVPTNGGMGAFRDFVIEVLKREGTFEETFKHVTKG